MKYSILSIVLLIVAIAIIYSMPQMRTETVSILQGGNLFFPSKEDTPQFSRENFLSLNTSLCEAQTYYGLPFNEEKIFKYKFTSLQPKTEIYYMPCQSAPDGVRGIPFIICGIADPGGVVACPLDINITGEITVSTKEVFDINSPYEALEYAIFLLYVKDKPFKPLMTEKDYNDLLWQEGRDCKFIKNDAIIKGARISDGYLVEFNFHNLNGGTLDYMKIKIDSDGGSELMETYPITNNCLS